MEWLEIAKSIGELGIMVVICAIFLYQNNKDRNIQNELNNTLFKTIIDKFNNMYSHGHVLTQEEDSEAAHIDKLINEYLQQAIKETDSSRAMVVRYHNGGKDMAAISFLKMSVTNEVVNIGYKPVIQDFQNQFRSMLNIVCRQLAETGESYIPTLETIKTQDVGTYEFLKNRGVRAMYSKALRNQNNYVIGFITVTFMEDNKIEENIENIEKTLDDKAKQISALLCL